MDPRQPEVDGRGNARSKRSSSEEPPESLGSRHDMRFEDLRERHRQMRHQLQVIHVRPIHVDFYPYRIPPSYSCVVIHTNKHIPFMLRIGFPFIVAALFSNLVQYSLG